MKKEIKFYIELNYGKRKPQFDIKLNDKKLNCIKEKKISNKPFKDKIIFFYEGELLPQNQLQLIQSDKTDNDLLNVSDNYIDHYIQIKELEVDGHYFETALYYCSEFRHNMSEEWVKKMQKKNIEILPYYDQCIDVRLNGVWQCNFYLPLWHFIISNKHGRNYFS